MSKKTSGIPDTNGMTNQNALNILADYIDDEDFNEWEGDVPVPPDLLWGLLKSYWEHFLADGTGLKLNIPPGAPPDGVTALEALAALGILMRQLQAARWWMAAEARKQRASWHNIGDALGITKQSAWEGFRKYAAEHETFAPSFRRLNEEYRALAGDSPDS